MGRLVRWWHWLCKQADKLCGVQGMFTESKWSIGRHGGYYWFWENGEQAYKGLLEDMPEEIRRVWEPRLRRIVELETEADKLREGAYTWRKDTE